MFVKKKVPDGRMCPPGCHVVGVRQSVDRSTNKQRPLSTALRVAQRFASGAYRKGNHL
jgi:hypothetical protein